jgi:hypothetical protein
MAQAQSKYLSAAEVVQRWGGAVTTGTLANWRTQGKGPPFVKLGSKVRYPVAPLEAWEAEHMVVNAANDNHANTERIAS